MLRSLCISDRYTCVYAAGYNCESDNKCTRIWHTPRLVSRETGDIRRPAQSTWIEPFPPNLSSRREENLSELTVATIAANG